VRQDGCAGASDESDEGGPAELFYIEDVMAEVDTEAGSTASEGEADADSARGGGSAATAATGSSGRGPVEDEAVALRDVFVAYCSYGDAMNYTQLSLPKFTKVGGHSARVPAISVRALGRRSRLTPTADRCRPVSPAAERLRHRRRPRGGARRGRRR
jgi:hypothetical protein